MGIEMSDSLSFSAEIRKVESVKTASGDIEYRLHVASDDPTINSLGLLGANTLIKLTVEVENNEEYNPFA